MTDEFDSSVPDSSSESFDSEPEVMPEIPSDLEPELESVPELIDEPEIEPAAEIQPEPELAPELMDEPEIEPAAEIQPEPELAPELIDEPEIEPAAEIQPEPESAPELTPELIDEPEIEPVAEIQSEPESAPELIDEPDFMDEPEIEPVEEIQPDLVDEYIGDEIFVDENPIDSEPSASDEVLVGNEIAPEIQNESQPETESTPESEVDEIPEYLAGLDAISQGDILQQAYSSAANPEMISEQDGLMDESSPEKQTTAGNEPEANVSSIVNTTGSYSQIGVQGSSVDLEDDGITPQPQIDEPSQRQPFKTDYSENDLGRAATEINNENMDINHTDAVLQKQIEQTDANRAEFRDTAAQYGMTSEQYLDYLGQRLNDPENTPELQPIQPADTAAQVDDVILAQGGSSGEIPLMPADINVIKDAQERDITIRRWGDDELIQLRAYDSAAGDVPETPNLGTAGMTNLKIEAEPDGQTKVRLQDIVIPPDYRRSGIAGNMLDETVDIAKAKDASEIYGVIENEEALGYWKHMEEKETGWKVDSSQGAYGYVRYDLNSPQQTQDLPSTISSTASSFSQFDDIPVSPSIPGMEKNSKPASENQLILEEIQQARANNDVEFERELQEDLRKFDENTKPNVQQLLAPTDMPLSNPPGGPPPPDDLPPKPISDGRFQVQQFGDDKQIYLRLHDLEKGAPPDQIYYGDAGRTNLKVEQNDNATRLRIQDAEVLPGYQEFDSSNTKLMLDKAIQISHEKGAIELYEEIGNNPAKLEFYKNQPGWVVDSSGSYARYSLKADSAISETGGALLDASQDRTIVQRELDVDEIRQVLDKTVESSNEIKNLDSKDARRNLYQKTSVGTLAEQLCYESTGSANLNEIIPNCPWADGIMPTEVQQIKSHVNTSVDKALGAYSSDLSDLLGGENSKIDKAVDGVWDLRSTEKWASISGSLPQEAALAEDKDSLKQALLSKSVLRIPFEDVKRVQDYVRKNVVENPRKYGLQNPSETDIEKLVERIKPISPNIDNNQLRLMAKDVFQRKMEIAGYPRGVAYAKDFQHSKK